MQLNTVIFDMDGLLIDSEPLWNEAANEVFSRYDIVLSPADYATTTGLRTREFVQWWFSRFNIPITAAPAAEKAIVDVVIDKFTQKGRAMPGVQQVFDFFGEQHFKIGIATSSGMELVNPVIDFLGIRTRLQAVCSGALLPYAKPHPQVYLDCAAALQSHPPECLCFEDSFHGMIAAKAARMTCVVVPDSLAYQALHWQAADGILNSLEDWGAEMLEKLQQKNR